MALDYMHHLPPTTALTSLSSEYLMSVPLLSQLPLLSSSVTTASPSTASSSMSSTSSISPLPYVLLPHEITSTTPQTLPAYMMVSSMNSSTIRLSTLIGDLNASYHNRLNESLYQSNCPSTQMPVGNTISMILYAIVCIVGLCGNTLVIYVVLRFSKMQTVTNMYILNLAIADECFLIGIPFLITTMYLGEWTFGKAMCKAYMVSTSITQFTSSIFLFIMSADRYIAVCHPISSPRYRSPFVSKVVSFCAWTTSALIMLPVMLYANAIEKNGRNKMSCIIEWPQDHSDGSGTTFTLYSLILGFATPLSLILGFYYLVLRKLQTVGPKTKSKEKKRSNRKVTKLVLTVITVYVLCWLPYWISQVALINSPPKICNSRLEITVFVLIGCLGYSNSAMNPILYAFLSDNFKKSFLKACTCATGKDINAQLQMDNSFFTRFGKRSSEKMCSSTKVSSKVNNNKATTTTTGYGGFDACGGGGGGTLIGAESAIIIDPTTATVALKSSPSVALITKSISQTSIECRPPVLHTDL